MNQENLNQKIDVLIQRIEELEENRESYKISKTEQFFSSLFSRLNATVSVIVTVFLTGSIVYAAVPHIFSNGTLTDADQMNENFSYVLDRTVPSGALMYFNLSACPAGWSELTDARGRVLVGLSQDGTLVGTVGTALGDLETRTITDVPSHTHNIDPPITESSAAGNHSHSVPSGAYHSNPRGPGDTYVFGYQGYHAPQTTSTNGDHTHSVDIASFTSDSTGSDSVDVTMPYIQALICQKD